MTRSDFLAITPADLRISDGNWKIVAHIGVLSHYPYFKDSVAMLELAVDKSVLLPDFSEDLVRRVIEFLYSGYLELPVEGSVQDIIAFLDAIHRFEDKYLLDLLNTPVRKRLQEIYRFCAEYAEKELTPLRSLPSHLLKDLVVSPLMDLSQTLRKDRITINGIPYDVNLTVLMARSLFFRKNLSKSSSIYIPEINQQFVEKWIESIYNGKGNSFSGAQKQNSTLWTELIDEKNAFECLYIATLDGLNDLKSVCELTISKLLPRIQESSLDIKKLKYLTHLHYTDGVSLSLEKLPHIQTITVAPEYKIADPKVWIENLHQLHGNQIQSINLPSCQWVNDEIVKLIAQKFPWLKLLNLDKCMGVTDVSMQLVGQNCLQLQGLGLEGCTGVTDDSIEVVGQNCRQLQRLLLNGCTGVTDASIKVVGQNCHQLERLFLEGCTRVTDVSMQQVRQECLKLERLIIRGTCISPQFIAATRQQRPRIVIE